MYRKALNVNSDDDEYKILDFNSSFLTPFTGEEFSPIDDDIMLTIKMIEHMAFVLKPKEVSKHGPEDNTFCRISDM